jgi:hypothetical protein
MRRDRCQFWLPVETIHGRSRDTVSQVERATRMAAYVWPTRPCATGGPIAGVRYGPIVAGGGRRDTGTTMYRTPLHRPSPEDDAYSAWLNAQQRRTAALHAWSAARRACRADANLASLLELELDATAAADLDQIHRRRFPPS